MSPAPPSWNVENEDDRVDMIAKGLGIPLPPKPRDIHTYVKFRDEANQLLQIPRPPQHEVARMALERKRPI